MSVRALLIFWRCGRESTEHRSARPSASADAARSTAAALPEHGAACVLHPRDMKARATAFYCIALTGTRSVPFLRNTVVVAFIPGGAAGAGFPLYTSCGGRKRTADFPAISMRGIKKENLPSKVCVVCNRPFTWRKKWERCWDEVTTCSKSCNGKRRAAKGAQSGAAGEVVEFAGADGAISTDEHAVRKANKKAAKATRRAIREGQAPESHGKKPCTLCGKMRDELIRCRVDESATWHMCCGSCWKHASGGVTDGDADHPYYVYGGLWRNRKQQGGPIDKALVAGLER